MAPEVLVCGADPELLDTRASVLSSAGFRVHSVIGLPTLGNCAHVASPALLILCHSLSTKDQAEGSAFSRKMWPGCQVLLLAVRGSAKDGLEHYFNTFEGPKKLMETARSLSSHVPLL